MQLLDADYTEGLRLFYLQQYDEALAFLTRAAEAGEAKAQHFLAMMYENGNGAPRDLARAAYWYGRAAEQGDREVRLTYAMILALGKGVEQDIAAACHYATLSFHQGNANALQALRIIRAQAVEAAADAIAASRASHDAGNDVAAAEQLRRAAECGSADAQYALAQMLLSGQGVAEDRRAAALWLREAAEQGHAGAKAYLAKLTDDALAGSAEAPDADEAGEAEA